MFSPRGEKLRGSWQWRSTAGVPTLPSAGAVSGEREVSAQVASMVDRVVEISDGGRVRSFRFAMDEVVVRDGSGVDQWVALVPPATPTTYEIRLRELPQKGERLPVLYPEGQGQTRGQRRVLTSSVVVQAAEGISREELVARLGMPVEFLPQASPRHAVVLAPSPLAALMGLDRWRNLAGVMSAEVLLAKQQSKRAMPNDPLVANQWHLKYQSQAGAQSGTDVNIESVWNYPAASLSANTWRGNGIRIGVVDDGLQTAHPDLSANVDVANGMDWNDSNPDPNPGVGDDHGTACAGNAAARGNNSLGVAGTAPEATLVGMRLIAASTTDAQEADAMSYRNDIIQVKTNSWGPDDDGLTVVGPGELTVAAFENGVASGRGGLGTIYLWAGGNGGDVQDNSNYDGYANRIETIAIAAYDSQNRASYYSEPGANLIVTAPSSGASPSLGITTVDRTGSSGYNASSSANGGDYTSSFGGTSSATPTVAGVVADLLQSKSTLGWRDVQEILIRSAKKVNPTSAEWANNGAGFHFHHQYGAGLVDAAAAIALASNWTNLPAKAAPVSSKQENLSVLIPNNNATGITRSFDLSASNLRAEHVTVRVKINHNASGDLAITLTSPSGMVSRLAEGHNDPANQYGNWTFMSTRHWGESSTGTWTVKLVDNTNGNTVAGTLTEIELTVHGTPGVPVNPAPVVQITSPTEGAVFTPGSTVAVSVTATDTVIGGGAGVVSSVDLYDNGSLVGTDTVAPYTFNLAPGNGAHALVARATDSEGKSADSATVNISLMNSPPVVTAATIGSSPAYDDQVLTVSGVMASDPDGMTPTIAYQWQSSVDGVNFVEAAGLTAVSLPADTSRSGLVWRCVVTANDGQVSSAPFYTNGVNLLDRPQLAVSAGSAYHYQSGLVLRSGGGGVDRDAILHEFSQGPSGGTAEWIEILVLRPSNLRYWDLEDNAGNLLVFQDTAVWENIPAGTRIVIYNGASKDAILPADDLDPSDHRMVISSTNATFFDPTYDTWLPLGNGGDAIYLVDADGLVVSELGYGTDTVAAMNIGAVGGGRAAYYTGNSDAGADVASNWKVTSSTVVRSLRVERAVGDLFISEYVEGSSNNKALELYNPSGAAVDLAAQGYKLEVYFNGATTAATNLTLTGTIPAGGTYVLKNNSTTGVIASVTAQVSNNGISFNGDDTIILRKGTTVVDCFGRLGSDPGTAWTGGTVSTADQTLRRKATILQGDVVTNDAFDPSVEWVSFAIDTVSGLGSHTVNSANPTLTVAVSPTSFAENAGASAAMGTVTVSVAPTSNLTVTLTSPDQSEVTVPATVTILANQTSATFTVSAVDDADSDGTQSVLITASASGYTSGSATVSVTDNEVSLEGVTPGAPNSPANAVWIASLEAGTAGSPALFRLAAGVTLPNGLSLNAATGLISGTLGIGSAGTYVITIERYNSYNEVVSQSFTLTVSAPTGYAGWIAGFNGLSTTALNGDADQDGLANGVEYYLGLQPGVADGVGAMQSGIQGNVLSLIVHRRLGISGITPVVEWSTSLTSGSWSVVGVTEQVLQTSATEEVVKFSIGMGEDPKKFLRLRIVEAP